MLRDAAAAVPARLRRKSLSAAGGLFLRAAPATALLENGLLTRQSHRALGTLLVAGTPHGETLLVRLLLSGYAGAIPHVHSTQQLAYGVLAQLPAPLGPSFWRASRRPDGPLYALDLAVRSDWTEAARVWCVLYADSHRLPAAVLDGAVSVAMTCLLLDAGAAVHANDYSALRGAAVGGDLPRLRVLMDAAGSSGPRALAARKGEALARAIAYGHLDVVEFLMAKVKQFQSDPARYPPAWDPPL
ncbi:hypothetical protein CAUPRSCDRAFT_12864 [Caulochytrium protostelioides]|uniref:Uncharacterized protein n=1 Tax=Caulochytrium protostelioides TaxID=1555241 RepID=A0A4P9WVL6_9FUNG|nr:hypothetical protein CAUPRSCDRAFT_12864 [Caulochytrium protostelioides]